MNIFSWNKPKIILAGGGKLAAIIYSIFRERFQFIGYIDDLSDRAYIEDFCGIKKLGTSKDAGKLLSICRNIVVSIGSIGDIEARGRFFKDLSSAGFKFPVLISPSARIAGKVSVGDGTVIEHNVVLNPAAKIGKNCVISNNCVIGHDAVIGNNVFVSAGTVINGETTVGDDTFVGSGTVIIQRLKVGSGCLIAAGACVTRNMDDGSRVAGVPARPIAKGMTGNA